MCDLELSAFRRPLFLAPLGASSFMGRSYELHSTLSHFGLRGIPKRHFSELSRFASPVAQATLLPPTALASGITYRMCRYHIQHGLKGISLAFTFPSG